MLWRDSTQAGVALGAHSSVVQAHLPLLVSDLCSGGGYNLSLLSAVLILVTA